MLTRAQQSVLLFIEDFIRRNSYAPTNAEIAAGIGIRSRGVVHRYLKALVDAQRIELVPQRKRNIRLLRAQTLRMPLFGKIAAGQPIDVVEDYEDIEFSQLFMGPGRYALRVQGDSMVDEGIYDGDIIICQETGYADNGKIVVALIDNESATLKRLQRNKDKTVTLFPANSHHQAQCYPAERVQIQGLFIGLLRLNGAG